MSESEKQVNHKVAPYYKWLKLIEDKGIENMLLHFLYYDNYYAKMCKLPASISGHHHLDETQEQHVDRTLMFASHLALEFNLSPQDRDILFASCILHDIANCDFTTKERNVNEHQKLYRTGFNRSKQAYFYHPTLAQFIIGKYIVDKKKIEYRYIKIADLVSRHMSHWFNNYNPEPKTLLGYLLCTADYFASRKEIDIKDYAKRTY